MQMNLGKSTEGSCQERGLLTETSHSIIGHFYPRLAEVGKAIDSRPAGRSGARIEWPGESSRLGWASAAMGGHSA